MNCEKCKESDNCDMYQSWLNTRDCCCPFGDYQKSLKDKKTYKFDNLFQPEESRDSQVGGTE